MIWKGGASSSKDGGEIVLGVTSLPTLPRDATDRNRTSPFAFTGNKFEVRAVGSSQSPAGPNIILNTIVTEALDEICTELDAAAAAGKEFNAALQEVLQTAVKAHKRILFNGDNYTDEWVAEAEARGLPNLKKTPEALKALTTEKAKAVFSKYGVLSEAELASRYEVYKEGHEEAVAIEARCAITMANTMIAPAALFYQGELAETVNALTSAGVPVPATTTALLATLAAETGVLLERIDVLAAAEAEGEPLVMLAAMESLRETADELEGVVPADEWPLPTYTELLFMY